MIPEENLGELCVLNVAEGDMKFSFNSKNKEEVEKAKQVIADMLKRGYAIFVEKDGKLKRVKRFDAKTCEYIVEMSADETKPDKKATKKKEVRLPAKSTRAKSIAPTAGG